MRGVSALITKKPTNKNNNIKRKKEILTTVIPLSIRVPLPGPDQPGRTELDQSGWTGF
jgi:hypothetical protein